MELISNLFLTIIVVLFFFVGRNKDNTPVLVLVGLLLVFINTRLIINYEMSFNPAGMVFAVLAGLFTGSLFEEILNSFKSIFKID